MLTIFKINNTKKCVYLMKLVIYVLNTTIYHMWPVKISVYIKEKHVPRHGYLYVFNISSILI